MAKKDSESEVLDDELSEDDMVDELSEDDQIDEFDDDQEYIDPETLKDEDYTKIKDLQKGMQSVNVIATIDFVGEKRTSHSGYSEADVLLPAIIKDETGEVKMTFWNKDVDIAIEGKKIRVINGYVTEYNGDLQLNSSRHQGVDYIEDA